MCVSKPTAGWGRGARAPGNNPRPTLVSIYEHIDCVHMKGAAMQMDTNTNTEIRADRFGLAPTRGRLIAFLSVLAAYPVALAATALFATVCASLFM